MCKRAGGYRADRPEHPFDEGESRRGARAAVRDQTGALQRIAASLREAYPDPAQANPLIEQAQAIYRQNFFPEMKMDWRTHPDHLSHKDWDGCFRCHDGKHKTADGQKSIAASDCRSCHIILAQGGGEQLEQLSAKGHDFIHVDTEFSDFSCAECHTGGVQK